MLRRHLLTLSASAAFHLTAVGVALVVAGAGAGPVILMDLVEGFEDHTGHVARPSTATGPGGSGIVRAQPAPARGVTGAPARRVHLRAHAESVPTRGDPVVVEAAPGPPARATAEIRLRDEPRPEPGAGEAPGARLTAPSEPTVPGVAPFPGSSASGGNGPVSDGNEVRQEGVPGTAAGAMTGAGAVSIKGRGVQTGPAGGGAGPAVALGTPGPVTAGIPPEYAPYLQRFRRRVQESLDYPLAARRQGLTGMVELEVVLDPSGRIGAVRVISSSSHGVLDDAALEAVRRLAPEPIPEHLPRRTLRLRLPLGFELR